MTQVGAVTPVLRFCLRFVPIAFQTSHPLPTAVPALLQAREGAAFILGGNTSDVEAYLHAKGLRAPAVVVCRPGNIPSHGSMHTKCIITFYESVCRVVITSGNLLPKDFERKTQSIWWQDFPSKSAPPGVRSARMSGPSDFEAVLLDYHCILRSEGGVPIDAVLERIPLYDFSTATVSLVTSVPGTFTGSSKHRYGHLRLKWLLEREAMPGAYDTLAPGDGDVRCCVALQCSSLGAVV